MPVAVPVCVSMLCVIVVVTAARQPRDTARAFAHCGGCDGVLSAGQKPQQVAQSPGGEHVYSLVPALQHLEGRGLARHHGQLVKTQAQDPQTHG
eukprot:CAMPEP_0173213722 /NCGR_PEP_ID=MMETSP1141-20130122/25563_1 /TAXON_ID=483371 /ORGANISM="non described non described, Strain CCMP2298" /LENGTH=93 /DNA_ID=CAMNT_0014140983 /DNA_START=118 /DNA_END=399 /DNA_ORIENTATION=+